MAVGGVSPAGEEGAGSKCRRVVYDHARGIKICADTGEVIKEGLIDGRPEWRRFSSTGESKGMVRAGTTLTHSVHDGFSPQLVITPKGKAKRDFRRHIQIRRGGRTRNIRSLVRGGVITPSDGREDAPLKSMLIAAHRLLRALDLHTNNMTEMVGWVLQAYYWERKKEGEEKRRNVVITTRERLAAAVVAIKKVTEHLTIPMSENEIYAALKDQFPTVNVEEVRSQAWNVLKRMNRYGIASRLRVRYNRSLVGMYTHSGARALNRITPFIQRLVRELDLPQSVANTAVKFVRAALHMGKRFDGKKPEAIAAAAVYFAARILNYEDVTQKRVAEVFGLTETNVRKAYRKLIEDTVVVVFV